MYICHIYDVLLSCDALNILCVCVCVCVCVYIYIYGAGIA
jgi:hypothetical protein